MPGNRRCTVGVVTNDNGESYVVWPVIRYDLIAGPTRTPDGIVTTIGLKIEGGRRHPIVYALKPDDARALGADLIAIADEAEAIEE